MVTYIQSLAGITTELLQEAREDTIASNQGNKLIQAFNSKEPQPLQISPLELIKNIAQQTIPKYIQWTINQYITDPTFQLKDIPNIKKLQQAYDRINTNKTNINTLNIKQLIAYLNEDQGGQHKYNTFANRFYQAMRTAVKNGDGVFKLESPDYCVYTPKNWEGSKCLRRANPDVVKLCTTFLDDSYHYNEYSKNGILDYILTPNTMYLCYISTKPDKNFEFADFGNIHQLAPLPKKVKDVLYPDFKLTNNIFSTLLMYQPKMTDTLEQQVISKLDGVTEEMVQTIKQYDNQFSKKYMTVNIINAFLNEIQKQADNDDYSDDDYSEDEDEHYDALHAEIGQRFSLMYGQIVTYYTNNKIQDRDQLAEFVNKVYNTRHNLLKDEYDSDPDLDLDFDEFCIRVLDVFDDEDYFDINLEERIVANNFPTFDDVNEARDWINKLQEDDHKFWILEDSLCQQDRTHVGMIELNNALREMRYQ